MLCPLCCLSGVCVCGDVTKSAKVGESVVLQSIYQKEYVDSIEWKFKKKIIAEYRESKSKVDFKSQFQGRLELNISSLSLTVNQIKKEDAGIFILTGQKKGGGQLDSKFFHLQVYGKLIILSRTLPSMEAAYTVLHERDA